jgi:hypothetical protein
VEAELALHRSLYDAGAVRELLPQYQGLASIRLDETENELRLVFSEIDPDVAAMLVDHFCNHALVETVTRRNQSLATLSGGAR